MPVLHLLLFVFDLAVIVCFTIVFSFIINRYETAYAQIMKKTTCLIEPHLSDRLEFGDDFSAANSSFSAGLASVLYS